MSTPTVPDLANLDFAESQGVYCDEVLNLTQWVLNQTNGVETAKTSVTGALALDTSSNIFAVSGTENLTSITGRVGGQVLLRFAAARTIVHHATSLILPGGANIVAAIGDIALMGADASGNWRCLLYQRATGKADNGYFPGDILFVAKNTAPTGFLKANGALVSRTTYAALFAEIGTTWGAGDGSTTFALPDLRGEFIRGWDDARGVDAGRVFGSAQADDFKSHLHTQYSYGVGVTLGANTIYQAAASLGTNTGSTGGTETRPRNVALLACIKY